MRAPVTWLAGALVALLSLGAHAFDHDYRDYGALLTEHVHMADDRTASTVDYAALKRDGAALQSVLGTWSAVTPEDFAEWSRDQQMAFLINAYNGFTLALILTEYPDLDSIRDLGSLFRSAWKNEFFNLLGKRRHLDWVEHETLRTDYPDARIHFAVNCASVGCPALQDQPFRAAELDAQMDAATRQFLQDRSRNHFDADTGTLHVTPLLRWYAEDFTVDGTQNPQAWLALHAEWLTDTPAERARGAGGYFRIDYTDYNWELNDVR
jgi:hypothetical protein